MKCKLCEKFYNKYPLKKSKENELRHQLRRDVFISPIKCAFESGVFVPDNWNCETMAKLRGFVYAHDQNIRDDNCAASFGYLHLPEECGVFGYLIMTWYKDRGSTGRAYIVWDDNDVRNLTIQEAEMIINYYGRVHIRKRS